MSPKPLIRRRRFGQTPEGEAVWLYWLENRQGLKVSVATYGATVVNILAPDRRGRTRDIALGFDRLAPYLKRGPYFGCTVGRFANRIGGARFTLDGKTYRLSRNEGRNSLHGGPGGFAARLWQAEPIPGAAAVRFFRRSPHGEEGYPGNLDVSVTFTLTARNELRIAYQAKTDRPTIVNLTNHTYFNLAGAGLILGHELTLRADRYLPVDRESIPLGKSRPVDGVMDFRKPRAIGARPGYDHTYVLKRVKDSRPDARLQDPRSGRWLEMRTDQPGVQLYTGNHLNGIRGKGGRPYPRYAGLCLETQHFPDSPRHPDFPSTVLRPGRIFQTRTVFRFGTGAPSLKTKTKGSPNS